MPRCSPPLRPPGWLRRRRSPGRPTSVTTWPDWASPATAGFGVGYRGLHGTDEQIALDSIPLVQAAYHQALLTLLTPP